MRNKRKCWDSKILPLILCGVALLFLSACGQGEPTNPSSPVQSSPTAGENTPAAEKSVQDKEVECDWTLSVNDTQKMKVNGYDMTCTLQINAVKQGGTDILGTYKGSAALRYEYDMQEDNVQGNAKGEGQDQNVSFDIVAYDVQAYSDHGVTLKKGDLPPLPPLTEQNAMGLGLFALTGSGDAKESAGSANWSTGESKTIQLPFKIAVGNSEAIVQLPTLASGALFKGMVIGTPIDAGKAGSQPKATETTMATPSAGADQTTAAAVAKSTPSAKFQIYGKRADGLPENYPDQLVPIYQLKKIMNSVGNTWGVCFRVRYLCIYG